MNRRRGASRRRSGQSVRLSVRPASASHFSADERPFELRFGQDNHRLALQNWGIPTPAGGVDPALPPQRVEPDAGGSR